MSANLRTPTSSPLLDLRQKSATSSGSPRRRERPTLSHSTDLLSAGLELAGRSPTSALGMGLVGALVRQTFGIGTAELGNRISVKSVMAACQALLLLPVEGHLLAFSQAATGPDTLCGSGRAGSAREQQPLHRIASLSNRSSHRCARRASYQSVVAPVLCGGYLCLAWLGTCTLVGAIYQHTDHLLDHRAGG